MKTDIKPFIEEDTSTYSYLGFDPSLQMRHKETEVIILTDKNLTH